MRLVFSSLLLNSAPLQSLHSTSPAAGVYHLTVLEMAYTLTSMTKTLNQLLCTGGVIMTPSQGSELMESTGPGGRERELNQRLQDGNKEEDTVTGSLDTEDIFLFNRPV